MKKKIFIPLFFILILLLVCSNKNKQTVIKTNSKKTGKSITIKITKGDQWGFKQKFGISKLTIIPQIAIWIEDLDENLIDTLYVTKKFAKQKWAFAKYDPDKIMRAQSLPYWLNKYIGSGNMAPTKNNPLEDCVTAATPKGDFTLQSKIDNNISKFVIFSEINSSFDENENYSNNETEYNGQPSLIYSAIIDLSDNKKEYKMTIIGHGGEKGSDGNLYNDLSTITNAKDIIKNIIVIID